jgi:hypothetical protein
MLERRAYGEPNKYEHSWKAVGEDEDGEDSREARLVDHLAQRNPAAAAFQSRTRPAADAARVRRDGDRRFQIMSGAGRHA